MIKGNFLILFLIFSLSFYGQNDTISVVKNPNISVVSADKMNVVYRGLPNPISISVPNCKSFEATGVGVYKVEERYQIVPGPGLESIVEVEIILLDGSVKTEEHKFRIKNIPRASGTINGLKCSQCIIEMSKEELEDAIISIDYNLSLYGLEVKDKVDYFEIEFSNTNNFLIFDNKLNDKALNIIKKLPIGSIFKINDIHLPNPNNVCRVGVLPIKIMIVKDWQTNKN